MEKILEQILVELKGLKDGQTRMETEINGIKTEINGIKTEINGIKAEIAEIKADGKVTREQTAELIEFRTETTQNISEIKDTLKFLLHKEIETEKEIFALKQIKSK